MNVDEARSLEDAASVICGAAPRLPWDEKLTVKGGGSTVPVCEAILVAAEAVMVPLAPTSGPDIACSFGDAPLSAGEGGSCSSSESESESDDSLPELSGESGLSGPSASSSAPSGFSGSGPSVAAGTGALLATATCRRTRGTIFTGDGRRSWYRAISFYVVYRKDNGNRTLDLITRSKGKNGRQDCCIKEWIRSTEEKVWPDVFANVLVTKRAKREEQENGNANAMSLGDLPPGAVISSTNCLQMLLMWAWSQLSSRDIAI